MLVIASNSVEEHHPLNQRHAYVVSRTGACINDLREVIDMDSWRTTTPFPFESLQAAPDTSFDKDGNPGSAPPCQWYSRIEAACRNL